MYSIGERHWIFKRIFSILYLVLFSLGVVFFGSKKQEKDLQMSSNDDFRTKPSHRGVAIRVDNLSKCYQIYDSPRDRLLQMILRGRRQYYKEFWALKDVSFSVGIGETIGIIGRNGSGKSTLLQMICSTLYPSEGNIEITGRVAALLELGAGFNPEFSGRENIFMAASLYGLTQEQIKERLEDIILFADIGEHIEQPVKTYSSGMYVRLAFAVIAHVDADILVIDEALAVGDVIFTQKCMRFIRDFKKRGTLLFVSHDMHSVLSLCETVIWLDKGKLIDIGAAKNISERYLRYTLQSVYGGEFKLEETHASDSVLKEESNIKHIDVSSNVLNGWCSGIARITDIYIENITSNVSMFTGGELLKLIVHVDVMGEVSRPIIGATVKNKIGLPIFAVNTDECNATEKLQVINGDKLRAELTFTLPMLANGSYPISFSIADGTLTEHVQHHWIHDAFVIDISSTKIRFGVLEVLNNSSICKV